MRIQSACTGLTQVVEQVLRPGPEVVRDGVGHWLGQVHQSHTQAVICEMSHVGVQWDVEIT